MECGIIISRIIVENLTCKSMQKPALLVSLIVIAIVGVLLSLFLLEFQNKSSESTSSFNYDTQSEEGLTTEAAISEAPPPQFDATVTVFDRYVLIEWPNSTSDLIDHYRVYRSVPEPGGGYILIGETSSNSFRDNIQDGYRYHYLVSSVSRYGVESQLPEFNYLPVDRSLLNQ